MCVFCESKEILKQKISEIEWGKPNATGEINNAFLVQEFIQGDEFVIDMVLDQNGIHTASVCRYAKGKYNGNHFVYEHMEMLDPEDVRFKSIIHYSHQCVKALDFKFGVVHMEVMHNDERTVMIEAGARLHGGIAPFVF